MPLLLHSMLWGTFTNMIDMDPENGNKGANRLDSRKTIEASELLNNNTEETKDEEI